MRHNRSSSASRWLVVSAALCCSAVPSLGQQHSVPDDVLYRHLFRHVAHYDALATKTELAGKPSSLRHAFRHKLLLNPNEEQDLNQVAAECMQQVHALDSQAEAILTAFHKEYPPSRPLPAGVHAPPPPPELADLSTQQRSVVLSFRDRFHEALGDQEFARVDAVLKNTVAHEIEPTLVR